MPENANSRLFKRAKKVIPGGVNSPVRAFGAVGGRPLFIRRAKGAYLYDVTGRRYIDYCLSWGPLILGHANRYVLDEVARVMAKGTSFGACTELEVQLAEALVDAIESVQKVRLVSSGTEAVMTAIRLARGYTGRDKIIKFAGCYHGHVDYLLIKAGSGPTTLGVPSSPGVPHSSAKHTVVCRYNDIGAVQRAFDRYGRQLAAVIVEPVAGNMGVVPPKNGFLRKLRELCTEYGSVLIFDEVITGFRLNYGSLQSAKDGFGVEADLTCLGKIIGGGFPIGAVGGRAELMDSLAPQGKIYQAGTLSGNPVCVAAGLATLKLLKAQSPYPSLAAATEGLCQRISQLLQQHRIKHTINRLGSMFTVFFNNGPVTDYATATRCDTSRYAKFFRGMLQAKVYLPPSQFESCFISTEHTQADFDKTVAAVAATLRQSGW
jgi:glutamate-1-semialdehyde 2,1-aminomutase